ncbi:MAG: helix-turn-helix domain-containing protein [Chloroflexi bacterium]|nr:helix-turn-helix domain-containing protein [Chloroflexota bacterium]MCI0731095.1 helix-turn-helix domain-containing protein [Chloroflexota bacterium]
MKQFLSATAFARLIDKDPKTIISWIKKGWIPGVQRLGHAYRIPHEELEKAKTREEYPEREVWPT